MGSCVSVRGVYYRSLNCGYGTSLIGRELGGLSSDERGIFITVVSNGIINCIRTRRCGALCFRDLIGVLNLTISGTCHEGNYNGTLVHTIRG